MTLADKLIDRITAREHETRTSYVLNLRGQSWGNQRQKTIRRQDHPDWPDKGSTVDTREEAEELMAAYAEWLAPRLERTAAAAKQTKRPQSRGLTWNLAIPVFLAAIEGNRPENTISNFRVALEKHVLPKWGDHPLTLKPEQVQPWINGIQAEKRSDGEVSYVDADTDTKKAVLYALRICFRHHFPDNEPTFKGVKIEGHHDDYARRKKAALEGRILDDVTGHDEDALRAALVQAAVNDYLGITSRPNVTRAIANTPDAIAWQVGTLARISELMLVRWTGIRRGATVPMVDIERAGGLLYLPGLKTSSATRWLVIFAALHPWIERMRRISLSPPDTTGFVFQTPGRDPSQPPSKKTYSNRMAKAQELAGVKLEGEATHIFRDTGATRLLARMEEQKVKLLLGHKAYTGATSKYANRTRIVEQLAPKIRTYLDGLLPHPTDVFAEATARLQALGHDVVLDPFPAREN